MTTTSTSSLKLYMREFIPAMVAYLVILLMVVKQRPSGGNSGIWELLPALPLIFVFIAMIRQYGRCDEFFKRIHSEAFALGAMTLGLFVTIWGFGENAGWPEIPTIFIGPALLAFWGLFTPIMVWRYK